VDPNGARIRVRIRMQSCAYVSTGPGVTYCPWLVRSGAVCGGPIVALVKVW